MGDSDEAARFWNEFEAETGEKVVAKTIGTYFEGAGDERGLWGLLVLTDASFRFKHLPSDNWITALFKSHRASPSPARALDIVVPRADLISLDEPRRGFLARFFGPAYPRFTLSWKSPEASPELGSSGVNAAGASAAGASAEGAFAADPSSDFLRALRALF